MPFSNLSLQACCKLAKSSDWLHGFIIYECMHFIICDFAAGLNVLLLLYDFLPPLCIHCFQMPFKQLKKSLNIIKIPVHLNKYIFLELAAQKICANENCEEEGIFQPNLTVDIYSSCLWGTESVINRTEDPLKKKPTKSWTELLYSLQSFFLDRIFSNKWCKKSINIQRVAFSRFSNCL